MAQKAVHGSGNHAFVNDNVSLDTVIVQNQLGYTLPLASITNGHEAEQVALLNKTTLTDSDHSPLYAKTLY